MSSYEPSPPVIEFPQIFGQIFDQIFGQVFGQVFGPEYSVQYYWGGEIQCTVLLGRKNLLHRLISKQKFKLFFTPSVSF